MKKCVLFLMLLFIVSCNDSEQAQPQISEPAAEGRDEKITVQPRAKVNLMPEAEAEIKKWPAFINTREMLKQVENYSIKEIATNSQSLATMVYELQATLPSNFKVPSIESRINVLITRALLLHQIINSTTSSTATIEEEAENLLTEFEYLKIQLNELFRPSPSEFEIDLLEIEAKSDSLRLETEKSAFSSL